MAAFTDLFGAEILTKDGHKATTEVLDGKQHVLIYFSAHWCPPCRGYTPELSSAYSQSAKAGKDTVIIFVSSDRDEEAFAEYYDSMSFYALPYAQRELKESLSEKFGVRGIPTLVVLDGDGNTVSSNARGQHGDYL
eukprot:TRINITY_DN2493_c0_g1_i2.p1 TRINITY_DN2493_c0_g1~~TRINITY_DN2493_c0_g1_i2.p1  ORF type:complete len:136 (-),score=37.15 TRINITY_DN2493_c0_g1_i2:181-588(-)